MLPEEGDRQAILRAQRIHNVALPVEFRRRGDAFDNPLAFVYRLDVEQRIGALIVGGISHGVIVGVVEPEGIKSLRKLAAA